VDGDITPASGDIRRAGRDIKVISLRRPRWYHRDITVALLISRRSAVISGGRSVILRRAESWRWSLYVVSYLGRAKWKRSTLRMHAERSP